VSAAILLDCLERVKRIGSDQWLARCPAHKDRSPSLSIRELNDGRVLVHCFAGCSAVRVLESLGLGWSALFPRRLPGHRYPAARSRIPARDLLAIISKEVSVAAIVAADMLANEAISEPDWKRLAQAAALIGKARDYVR
jgi:hypothetical protein